MLANDDQSMSKPFAFDAKDEVLDDDARHLMQLAEAAGISPARVLLLALLAYSRSMAGRARPGHARPFDAAPCMRRGSGSSADARGAGRREHNAAIPARDGAPVPPRQGKDAGLDR